MFNRKKLSVLVFACFMFGVLLSSSFNSGFSLRVEAHVSMYHYRDGVLVGYSHHPAVLTVGGQDWIKGKLADSGFVNGSTYGLYIALSDDSSSPSSSWSEIPNEITGGGLDRALGSYVSTGVGSWNVTFTFSPTVSGSCRLTGVYWDVYSTKSLIASDVIALIMFSADTDTIKIVWQFSVV